jgi:hypothetical protein
MGEMQHTYVHKHTEKPQTERNIKITIMLLSISDGLSNKHPRKRILCSLFCVAYCFSETHNQKNKTTKLRGVIKFLVFLIYSEDEREARILLALSYTR